MVVCVFVIKGAWWMPWHAEPMKDVKGLPFSEFIAVVGVYAGK